jgi:hypothetical protein
MNRLQIILFSLVCVYRASWSALVSGFLAPTGTSSGGRSVTKVVPLAPPSLLLAAEDPSSDIDEEWHPRDPAQSTPQLLAALWHQISHAGNLVKGVRDLFLLQMYCGSC